MTSAADTFPSREMTVVFATPTWSRYDFKCEASNKYNDESNPELIITNITPNTIIAFIDRARVEANTPIRRLNLAINKL